MEEAYYSIISGLILLIHIIVNHEMLCKSNRSTKPNGNTYYRKFIIIITAFYISDILWGIFAGANNILGLYIDTIIFYLTMAASVSTWSKVVSDYLRLKKIFAKILRISGLTYFVGHVIGLFINHFAPFFFWIDDTCGFHRSTGRYVSVMLQLLSFTIVGVTSLVIGTKKKGNGSKRHYAIFSFSVVMIIATIVQYLLPFYPIYSMGLILGTCLVHVFVQEDEENEIREKLEENTSIISNAGYGIWKIRISSGGHNRMSANATLKSILGIEDVKLTPEELYDFYHSRLITDRNDIENNDYMEMLDGRIKSRLLLWNHSTKGRVYLRTGGSCQTLQNGLKIISGYCSDVTEQKLEADRLNAELEVATIQAEAANKAKTTFLFNMSHDIRTPMNAIIGFTELLAKNGDNPDKREDYIGKIRSSSRFLLSLINNVLEMARIESGKAVLEEKTNDIEDLRNDLLLIFKDQLEEKNIEFTHDVVVRNRYVYCDIVKVREIFLNILSNAYKYTPEGGKIRLEVREVESTNSGYATFRTKISDTGIGMSKEFIPRIFDEFSRAKNMTYSKVEGTGLGMPIVKKLIELMEGIIQVESELGKGTTFTVYLTHKISDETENDKEENVEDKYTYFSDKRILLVEDNELNSEIAMELLKEMGFAVEIAVDGLDCIEKYQKAPTGYFDLILMDIQMPQMNGYEAARSIRGLADKEKADIPIVAMTANAFASDREEAIKSGMNDHLAKPINIVEVNKTLGKFLNN